MTACCCKIVSFSIRAGMGIGVSTGGQDDLIEFVLFLWRGQDKSFSTISSPESGCSLLKVDLDIFLAKYFLKYAHDISAVVTDRENTHVFLTLEWHSVFFHSLVDFARSKFPHGMFQKLSTTDIFVL